MNLLQTLSIIILTATTVLIDPNHPPERMFNVQQKDVLGECSTERWLEYLTISEQAAPMRFGGGPIEFGISAFDTFRQNMNAESFALDTTYFVAVDATSGRIFRKACAGENCTFREANEPEAICLENGGENCVTAALVFQNETFCLTYPRSAGNQ